MKLLRYGQPGSEQAGARAAALGDVTVPWPHGRGRKNPRAKMAGNRCPRYRARLARTLFVETFGRARAIRRSSCSPTGCGSSAGSSVAAGRGFGGGTWTGRYDRGTCEAMVIQAIRVSRTGNRR